MLVGEHRLTADLGTAAAMAVRAGLDSELPTTAGFGEPLRAAIADGRVDRGIVDLAVERILRLKFRLGLFERPYVDAPSVAALDQLEAEERTLAAELVRRSIVLLENDGVLPLAADGGRIAVVGPIADSARDLMGDYAHMPHIETLAELRHRANPFGFPSSDVIQPTDEADGLADDPGRAAGALRRRPDRVRRGHGPARRHATRRSLEAVAAARAAEVAVVVVGERSGPDVRRDHRRVPRPARPPAPRPPAGAARGRGRDRDADRAAGRQRPAARARVGVRALLGRRPRVGAGRGRARRRSPRSSRATRTPGGRLPITMPRHVGQVPADLPPPSDGRPVELEGRLRGRLGRAAVAVRPRALVHDVLLGGAAGRPRHARHRRRRGRRPRRRHQHRARERARMSSSSTSATRRPRSRARSSSCAGSGASASSPASAARSRSGCRRAARRSPAPTTGGWSSPAMWRSRSAPPPPTWRSPPRSPSPGRSWRSRCGAGSSRRRSWSRPAAGRLSRSRPVHAQRPGTPSESFAVGWFQPSGTTCSGPGARRGWFRMVETTRRVSWRHTGLRLVREMTGTDCNPAARAARGASTRVARRRAHGGGQLDPEPAKEPPPCA